LDPSSSRFQQNVNLDHHAPTYEHTAPVSFARDNGDGWTTSKPKHTHDPEHSSFMANFSFGEDSAPCDGGSLRTAVVIDLSGDGGEGGVRMDLETDSDLLNVLPLAENGNTSYTGSYWLVPSYSYIPLASDHVHTSEQCQFFWTSKTHPSLTLHLPQTAIRLQYQMSNQQPTNSTRKCTSTSHQLT
jgi:hypothetical protein